MEIIDILYKKALRAVETLYTDNSVPPAVTKEKLEELIEEIQMMIIALNV